MAIKFRILTSEAIRSLEPKNRLTEHGITIDRLGNDDLRYSINIMVDGQRIHRVIGKQSEGITREQAERAIETFRTRAREGRLDLPQGRKTRWRFADAGNEYLTRIKNHPKFGRNRERKKYHMRNRLIPFFKDQPLCTLNDRSIADFVQVRQRQEAASATINRELATLRHFLNRCVDWGLVKTKPKVSMCEESPKKIRILSDNEQTALVRTAADDHDHDVWLFVIIALGSGMRHSEILRVRWEDIDFANKRIYVEKAKAGQRHQPIPPSLVQSLKDQWVLAGCPKGHIFPNRRSGARESHRSSMAAQFKRCVVKAGLSPQMTTPHILRHTAITRLVQAGVDLPTIQRFSGHKTLAMVLRYTQLSDEHLDRSVAKLDDSLTKSITPILHTAVA